MADLLVVPGVDKVVTLCVRILPSFVIGYGFLAILPGSVPFHLARCFIHIGIFAVVSIRSNLSMIRLS